MKKVLSFMLVICMLFSLAACGNSTSEQGSTASPSSREQSNSGTDSQDTSENNADQEIQKIDVDLTQLSSTMVYSEVYNMMYTPEDYIGKTVKMNGAFTLYCQKVTEDGQPDFNYPIYYACVIADATSCCYPDDYPKLGGNITVTGTFETYEEDGNQYSHLVNAVLE